MQAEASSTITSASMCVHLALSFKCGSSCWPLTSYAFQYLSHRIVFYLTNLHIKSRTTFFVRAGAANEEDSYRADGGLSEAGKVYATKMTETLLKHREQERQSAIEAGGPDVPLRPLTVWTSTRLRTVQTAKPLQDEGYKIRQRSQMSQINPGVCEKLSERAIRSLYPEEIERHDLDPYHHRYPRAEVSTTGSLFRCSFTNTTASPTTTSLSASNPSFLSSSVNKTTC